MYFRPGLESLFPPWRAAFCVCCLMLGFSSCCASRWMMQWIMSWQQLLVLSGLCWCHSMMRWDNYWLPGFDFMLNCLQESAWEDVVSGLNQRLAGWVSLVVNRIAVRWDRQGSVLSPFERFSGCLLVLFELALLHDKSSAGCWGSVPFYIFTI